MELNEIKYFIEAALLAAGRPLNVDQLQELFDGRSAPEKNELRKAIAELNDDYAKRGIEIADVASGFRMQVKSSMAERLQKLWEERPPRYSRALFETLALIAYRQPMTRGEIEEVRGVSVSSNIVRSLLEREWVRVVGHRDVPGRPALFGTTKLFLDYFGLKKLDDLPPLADLSDWESLRVQLNLPEVEENAVAVEGADMTDVSNDAEAVATAAAELESNDDSNVGGDELPVLEPESAEDDVVAEDPDDEDVEVAAAESSDESFDEIVATEWPDPGKPADAAASADIDDDDDVGAKASGA